MNCEDNQKTLEYLLVLHEVLIELVGTFLKTDFDCQSYRSSGFESAVAAKIRLECLYNFHSIDDLSLRDPTLDRSKPSPFSRCKHFTLWVKDDHCIFSTFE
jgi:hypothetical protein